VQESPQLTAQIVENAYQYALENFQLSQTQQQIDHRLTQITGESRLAKPRLSQI
jgi:hypothetical protein